MFIKYEIIRININNNYIFFTLIKLSYLIPMKPRGTRVNLIFVPKALQILVTVFMMRCKHTS